MKKLIYAVLGGMFFLVPFTATASAAAPDNVDAKAGIHSASNEIKRTADYGLIASQSKIVKGDKGLYVLTLIDPSKDVKYEYEQPYRGDGTVSIEDFAGKLWHAKTSDSFEKVAPNGFIRADNVTIPVEFFNPIYKNGVLTFDIVIMDSLPSGYLDKQHGMTYVFVDGLGLGGL